MNAWFVDDGLLLHVTGGLSSHYSIFVPLLDVCVDRKSISLIYVTVYRLNFLQYDISLYH